MKTELKQANDDSIREAAELIQSDNVVAFSTETVYGLGANALKSNAVKRIFEAKGRPADNPLIIHISDEEMLKEVAIDVPETAKKLMVLWPGPLTIVLRKRECIPDVTTGGLHTVGIRMPSDPVFRRLISACGCPIAAPSANSFGKPSPTTARHVLDDMNGKIPLILDGGQCDVGIESTIVDCTRNVPMLLRPGKITVKEIESLIGSIELHPCVKDPNQKLETTLAPGMKYRHYSPNAEVILVKNSYKTQEIISEVSPDKKIGLITNVLDHSSWGTESRIYEDSLMQNLFFFLRELDKNVDVIIIEGVFDSGLGVMNRILKAASRVV